MTANSKPERKPKYFRLLVQPEDTPDEECTLDTLIWRYMNALDGKQANGAQGFIREALRQAFKCEMLARSVFVDGSPDAAMTMLNRAELNEQVKL